MSRQQLLAAARGLQRWSRLDRCFMQVSKPHSLQRWVFTSVSFVVQVGHRLVFCFGFSSHALLLVCASMTAASRSGPE